MSNANRIGNTKCNLGVSAAHYFNLREKDAMDLTQADIDMVTAAMKRWVVYRAFEGADVAESLTDP